MLYLSLQSFAAHVVLMARSVLTHMMSVKGGVAGSLPC